MVCQKLAIHQQTVATAVDIYAYHRTIRACLTFSRLLCRSVAAPSKQCRSTLLNTARVQPSTAVFVSTTDTAVAYTAVQHTGLDVM